MRLTAVSVITTILCATSAAFANGLELLPGGTESVARGGAVVARPVDGMALIQNPAGLAFVSGQQIMLDIDVPVHHMCVDPYGYYGWGVYSAERSEFGDPVARGPGSYAETPLPKICNSARVGGLPQLTWVKKLSGRFSIGAGFAAPTVVTGLQYGGADGTIETPSGPRPTPTRYSLIRQQGEFALDPVVGAAYRFMRSLSAGLSFQVFMLKAKATAVQGQSFGGTQPATDALVDVETQDYFVPAITLSTQFRPIEAVNLVAAFRWIDVFDGSGTVDYETNTFHEGSRSGPVPFKNEPIALSKVVVRQPWQVTLGARYSAPLSEHPGGTVGDPMDRELWDVEVDGTYYLNAQASKSDISIGHDVTLVTRNADGTSGSNTARDLGQFTIDRHLKDSVAIRVGGSFAILPRELMVQAGGFFETRGIDAAYADIDTFAFQRVGTGVGAILRVGEFDFKVGYAHIFSETLDLAPPPHQNVEKANPADPRSGFDKRIGGSFADDGTRIGGQVAEDPSAPSPSGADAVAAKTQQAAAATLSAPNRVINAGKYTASFDIISIGAVYHF